MKSCDKTSEQLTPAVLIVLVAFERKLVAGDLADSEVRSVNMGFIRIFCEGLVLSRAADVRSSWL